MNVLFDSYDRNYYLLKSLLINKNPSQPYQAIFSSLTTTNKVNFYQKLHDIY